MTLKAITANNIKTRRTSLNQLVDLIQEDISGSATRRKYQVFVTGGVESSGDKDPNGIYLSRYIFKKPL